ncbi:kinesin family member C2/C3 [Angomonas deanei]|nr:kinesin family member C2/C3 [Angomonas deanei]|eukprot:EPY36832.1 kinesin family member C2/C3 [Angomonas deanei]
MRMLETDTHKRIEPELMNLIARFSDALEIYEAMTGTDLGEGQAAKARAAAGDEEMAEADSDDDDYQKRLRARAKKSDPNQAVIEGQQQVHQLMDKQRNETNTLRQQLEELRQKHEHLQNKYNDAKAKNREAVAALEEMHAAGGGGGGGGAVAVGAFPVIGGKVSLSAQSAQRMRQNAQALRQGLRELRDHHTADISREAQYYAAQLNSAMAAIVQAGQMERQSDQKALQWTQDLYKKELKLRKQYYNTIQELKGNIRVYCRVRPMLKKEIDEGRTNIMTFPSTDELKFIDANGRPKLFEFDEVYPPEAPQAKVFEDTSPLIDSVVDGYNVCIFAYGQTGSGKTFTMGGGDGESKGINTRALERLFQIIEERKETEDSNVTVSVLEIYIEQIRDLLVSKQQNASTTYDIKQGGPTGTYVTNLSEVKVNSPSDIHSIMAKAQKNRSEGSTNMNEHSSRSHMILYITVRTTNKQTNLQTYGKLSLVDLAGSERLDKSGAVGQAQKEAVSINKSLSALGDVISGLSQSTKHIPFRNSVLTFLLQDSMAGQAKVLMFVCVGPADYNASESSSSLLFASRARGVAFGQIKKNAATEKQ